QDRYWAYFDEAWKKIIERFFPQLLCFFVPKLYKDVDFSKGFDFLDKEMKVSSSNLMVSKKVVIDNARFLYTGQDICQLNLRGCPKLP
ncbi:MAG: hypothetical protein QME81_20295, partial [bacterium]|nr:hypothetical protein [bacterium]